MADFKLSEAFLKKYQNTKPPFGFNGLGELVYLRTYSRLRPDGRNEVWWETVKRVVEWVYNAQKRWIEDNRLEWNPWKAQSSAQEFYDRMFNMKFLPPGRGLWTAGTPILEEKGLSAALLSCAFVSTENLKEEGSKPFCFLTDMSMLGVGVGMDTNGADQLLIKGPNKGKESITYVIPDTREGWVESIRLLIDSYLYNTAEVQFDYSEIRKEGEPLKIFGGVSSGYKPLEDAHIAIRDVLERDLQITLGVSGIADIANLIGKCVVSGNIRRSSEILFGDPESEEYLDLKNYEKNPHRESYGWNSNNSVFGTLGADYTNICERILDNGEPGLVWMENVHQYGRVNGTKDTRDFRTQGTNPCGEQVLESYEACTLAETFPFRHESLADFKRTLKYAYLYAKTVTLQKTHWPETNRVMLRNRRIGCSVSGIAQFIDTRSLGELKTWLRSGYEELQRLDEVYSEWLAVPRSIRLTTNKPSGSVSLLTGATPGIHYPESRFYIRRVRMAKNSPLIKPLVKAGYKIEPAFGSEETTVVVEILVDVGPGIRTAKDISMWEQLSLAAFMQKHWSDNSVSVSITFDPETEGPQLKSAIDYFQYQLKSVSFLPRKELGAYPQMPYEAIDEAQYNELVAKLKPIKWGNIKGEEADPDKFCDSTSCAIEWEEDGEKKED